MRLLVHEYRKLLEKKALWIAALCLLIANAFFVWMKTIEDPEISPALHRAFFSETADMTASEANDFLDAQIENALSGYDSQYPVAFLLHIQEETADAVHYAEYIDMIVSQKNTMSMLFNNEDSFSYRNIQKTPPAYQAVMQIEPAFAISDGVIVALNSPLTDLLAIVLALFFTIHIFTQDRETGCIRLLFSFKNGRIGLFLTQLAVSFGISAVIALLFFIENLLIGHLSYGLGDLNRPIQSVYGWLSCNLALSVKEYLFLFFAAKVISYLFLSGIVALLTCIARNNLILYGMTGGFFAISFLAYRFVPETSPWSLLHYWNGIFFTQTNAIFSGYQNVNLFGDPVSLKISAVGIMVLGIMIMAVVGGIVFSKFKNKDYRTYSLHFLKVPHFVHSRWYYTFYKVLVLRKGFLIVLLLFAVQTGLFLSFRHPYSNDELYYYRHTTALETQSFEDAKALISEKMAYYAEIENKIAAEMQEEQPNPYQIELLSNEMNDRAAIERIKKRVQAMEEHQVNTSLFYDTGYERLLCLDGNRTDLVYVIILTLFLALFLSPHVCSDREMRKLIDSSRSGKAAYWKDTIGFGCLTACAGSAFLSIASAIQMLESYGTQGLSAPIQSVSGMAENKLHISVLGFLILLLLWRMIIASICSGLMLMISHYSKNAVMAIMINLLLFTLPAVISALVENKASWFGFTELLSGVGCLL